MKAETINGLGSLFRFITPVLITISLFILGQIWVQLSDMNTKIYVHVTNAELHTPRSELTRIEVQIAEMRKEVIATIRNEKRF